MVVLEISQIVQFVLTQGGDDLWVGDDVHNRLGTTLQIVQRRQHGRLTRFEFYPPRKSINTLPPGVEKGWN